MDTLLYNIWDFYVFGFYKSTSLLETQTLWVAILESNWRIRKKGKNHLWWVSFEKKQGIKKITFSCVTFFVYIYIYRLGIRNVWFSSDPFFLSYKWKIRKNPIILCLLVRPSTGSIRGSNRFFFLLLFKHLWLVMSITKM